MQQGHSVPRGNVADTNSHDRMSTAVDGFRGYWSPAPAMLKIVMACSLRGIKRRRYEAQQHPPRYCGAWHVQLWHLRMSREAREGRRPPGSMSVFTKDDAQASNFTFPAEDLEEGEW